MKKPNLNFFQLAKDHYLVIFLALSTLWLRFVNLGYSDFQGDEIKALYLPLPDQTFADFILSQRKGPIQFIITYLLKFVDPLYTNQFLIRLPFAVAGVLAIYFFYKLILIHFGKKIALYSAILLSANGILVAFSRLVQYQSVSILFSILTLYMFSKAVKEKKYNVLGLYYGMIFWGISVLSHYDGFFVLPFALFILYQWFRKSSNLNQKEKIKHLLLSGLLCGVILAIFYIPFILSVTESTKDYWLNRLSGGSNKISSSIITFKAYNPKLMVYIYGALGLVSLLKIKDFWKILVWFMFPWIFMELVTNIPGTHIYTYLIPAVIIISHGIIQIEVFMEKFLGGKRASVINALGLSVFFVFAFYLSHKVFVDHSVEYPWENEKFLVWELQKPNVIFHLSMFGFPYYRHWEEIGEFVNSSENNNFYSTNERTSISRYHIPFNKDTDSAGHYVYIHNPQSFTNDIVQDKAAYWAEKYPPVASFTNNGKVVSEVFYMPPGTLDEIESLGW